MPTEAVYVGRPTKWGNPYILGRVGNKHRWTGWYVSEVSDEWANHGEYPTRQAAAARAVELCELHTGPMGNYELDATEVRRELDGRDLACWCPLKDERGNRFPCHADVLLKIANSNN